MASPATIEARPRLTGCRATQLVLCVSVALHLMALAGVPLMITPDGQRYLRHTFVLLGHDAPGQMFSYDVPGLPFYLAAWFGVLGITPMVALLAQHALGVFTALCIVRAALAISSPRVALGIGLFAAFDPWSLMFSTYVLTEPLASALIAAATWLVLASPRASLRRAALLGGLLAAAMLTRPACAAFIPFLAAAYLWRSGRGQRLRGGVLVAASLLALLVAARLVNPLPSRGGFREGLATILYLGTGMFGMVERADIADEPTRVFFDSSTANFDIPNADARQARFLDLVGVYDSSAAALRVGGIATRAIARQPGTYVANTFFTTLWLLNAGVNDRPPMYDELAFLAWRPSLDGRDYQRMASNFEAANFDPKELRLFEMHYQASGPVGAYITWARYLGGTGLPHVPLFLATIAGLVVAVRSRNRIVAFTLLAPATYLLAHAALLAAITRYSTAALPALYVGTAYAVQAAVDRFRRRSTGVTVTAAIADSAS